MYSGLCVLSYRDFICHKIAVNSEHADLNLKVLEHIPRDIRIFQRHSTYPLASMAQFLQNKIQTRVDEKGVIGFPESRFGFSRPPLFVEKNSVSCASDAECKQLSYRPTTHQPWSCHQSQLSQWNHVRARIREGLY